MIRLFELQKLIKSLSNRQFAKSRSHITLAKINQVAQQPSIREISPHAHLQKIIKSPNLPLNNFLPNQLRDSLADQLITLSPDHLRKFSRRRCASRFAPLIKHEKNRPLFCYV
jgi:hypothetical protein